MNRNWFWGTLNIGTIEQKFEINSFKYGMAGMPVIVSPLPQWKSTVLNMFKCWKEAMRINYH